MMRVLIGLVLLFSCLVVNAQPPTPPPPNPVPITGIEILVGAGALLGAKRMLANRKTKT